MERATTPRVPIDARAAVTAAAGSALPLLADKQYAEPSVFQPEALLRQARRQRGVPDGTVPRVWASPYILGRARRE